MACRVSPSTTSASSIRMPWGKCVSNSCHTIMSGDRDSPRGCGWGTALVAPDDDCAGVLMVRGLGLAGCFLRNACVKDARCGDVADRYSSVAAAAAASAGEEGACRCELESRDGGGWADRGSRIARSAGSVVRCSDVGNLASTTLLRSSTMSSADTNTVVGVAPGRQTHTLRLPLTVGNDVVGGVVVVVGVGGRPLAWLACMDDDGWKLE